jgi:mono/diheme cytochrome c family protein
MNRILLAVLAAAPLLASPALADDGAKTFETYCAMCHGAQGKGDGAAAAGLTPKPADFSTAEFWKGKDDAYLTKVVKEGGAAVGKSAMMAPWGGVLNDEQVKGVVAFVKTLAPKDAAAK